jgi:hypothetical protein
MKFIILAEFTFHGVVGESWELKGMKTGKSVMKAKVLTIVTPAGSVT